MTRKRLPSETEQHVLISSRRRCCLCFWLEGVDEVQKGQIAHIDQNNQNAARDNLAFLCLDHHDELDSRTKQSKGLTSAEVKKYRDELYKRNAENRGEG